MLLFLVLVNQKTQTGIHRTLGVTIMPTVTYIYMDHSQSSVTSKTDRSRTDTRSNPLHQPFGLSVVFIQIYHNESNCASLRKYLQYCPRVLVLWTYSVNHELKTRESRSLSTSYSTKSNVAYTFK